MDDHCVSVIYSCDNIDKVDVKVLFDKDGEGIVALRSWSLGNVKADKLAAVLVACNKLNDQYRWVKFYIDSDNDIAMALDAVVDIRTVGAECLQLVRRMVNICDEAYPVIMQAIWGGKNCFFPQTKPGLFH